MKFWQTVRRGKFMIGMVRKVLNNLPQVVAEVVVVVVSRIYLASKLIPAPSV